MVRVAQLIGLLLAGIGFTYLMANEIASWLRLAPPSWYVILRTWLLYKRPRKGAKLAMLNTHVDLLDSQIFEYVVVELVAFSRSKTQPTALYLRFKLGESVFEVWRPMPKRNDGAIQWITSSYEVGYTFTGRYGKYWKS
jgi:hypothetical protein